MIPLSVNMVSLICFAIGEDVLEKKTVAILEAWLAVLGVTSTTLAVFRGATDCDWARCECMDCGRRGVRRTCSVALLVALMAVDEAVGILVSRVRVGLLVLLGCWLVGDGGVNIELSLVVGGCRWRVGAHLGCR